MSDVSYYEQSYPPSLWDGGSGGRIPIAPYQDTPDAQIDAAPTVAQKLAIANGRYVGNPSTPWTGAEHVLFGTTDQLTCLWNGSAWVETFATSRRRGRKAASAEVEPDVEVEVEPDEPDEPEPEQRARRRK